MNLGYENVTQSVGLLSSPNHTNIVARPLTSFLNGYLSLDVAAGDWTKQSGAIRHASSQTDDSTQSV